MKLLFASIVGVVFWVGISPLYAQVVVVGPAQVLRNPKTDKSIRLAIKTKDPKYSYSEAQEGRYKIVRARGVEMWFNNYTKSVEVYELKINMDVATVKREFAQNGFEFVNNTTGYKSSDSSGSKCYAVQLAAISARITKVTFSWECD